MKPEYSKQVTDAFALKAQHESRLAALPKDAAGYKVEPPKEFKVPDGWTVDEKHPLAAPVRAIAHKHQLPQEAVSDLVQAFGEMRVAESKAYNDAVSGETKKLGANATARVTAVKTWLASALSPAAADDLLGAGDDKPGLVIFSEAAIKHLEDLQSKFTAQGGGTFNGTGRSAPAPVKPPQEQRWYPNMVPTQQKAS